MAKRRKISHKKGKKTNKKNIDKKKYNNIINNIIIATIEIKEKNSKKRIINSLENAKFEDAYYFDWDKNTIPNEAQIKQCEIYINDTKVDFNYYFIFPDIGTYTIKYKFNSLLTSTNFMFFECSLTYLDFSHFNTKNVKNMSFMFFACHHLEKIDLSNFNTQNVINMEHIFDCCT